MNNGLSLPCRKKREGVRRCVSFPDPKRRVHCFQLNVISERDSSVLFRSLLGVLSAVQRTGEISPLLSCHSGPVPRLKRVYGLSLSCPPTFAISGEWLRGRCPLPWVVLRRVPGDDPLPLSFILFHFLVGFLLPSSVAFLLFPLAACVGQSLWGPS